KIIEHMSLELINGGLVEKFLNLREDLFLVYLPAATRASVVQDTGLGPPIFLYRVHYQLRSSKYFTLNIVMLFPISGTLAGMDLPLLKFEDGVKNILHVIVFESMILLLSQLEHKNIPSDCGDHNS
ncbi:hypothetical protein ACJX0J_021581, partial [Zea mays]